MLTCENHKRPLSQVSFIAPKAPFQSKTSLVYLEQCVENHSRQRTAPEGFQSVVKGLSHVEPVLPRKLKLKTSERRIVRRGRSSTAHFKPAGEEYAFGEIPFLKNKLGFTLPSMDQTLRSETARIPRSLGMRLMVFDPAQQYINHLRSMESIFYDTENRLNKNSRPSTRKTNASSHQGRGKTDASDTSRPQTSNPSCPQTSNLSRPQTSNSSRPQTSANSQAETSATPGAQHSLSSRLHKSFPSRTKSSPLSRPKRNHSAQPKSSAYDEPATPDLSCASTTHLHHYKNRIRCSLVLTMKAIEAPLYREPKTPERKLIYQTDGTAIPYTMEELEAFEEEDEALIKTVRKCLQEDRQKVVDISQKRIKRLTLQSNKRSVASEKSDESSFDKNRFSYLNV